MVDSNGLSGFLEGPVEFGGETSSFGPVSSPDDIFGILETFENFPPFLNEANSSNNVHLTKEREEKSVGLASQRSTSSLQEYSETELEASPQSNKRPKLATEIITTTTTTLTSLEEANVNNEDGQLKMSHITVERNRRKQMNEHLSVLRSLMPCFYVKRGDQASIIGGVVEYINELQQVLQSLEAKKQRKVYSEVLSPRVQQQQQVPSPRLPPGAPSPLSPRRPPPSPRLSSLPISPRTPQPTSPYPNKLPPPATAQKQGYNVVSPSLHSPTTSSAASSSAAAADAANELVASSKSAVAEVEVKFAGANLVLKTASPRIPGQAVKVAAALEDLGLEILRVTVGIVDDTMLNSFTIKIGIECQLSAEELAQRIQQTFSQS